MPKEVKMYEADNGELFKTKKGAENHNKRNSVTQVLNNLQMTKEEISDSLNKVKEYNVTIKALLKLESDWTDWPSHLIKQIDKSLFTPPKKKTMYIMEQRGLYKTKDKVLFEEEGLDFSDEGLHCGDEYRVISVKDITPIERRIVYDYKYSREERLVKKIKSGERLTPTEIIEALETFDTVYIEEGEDRRWSRTITTVIDVYGYLYAIDWEQGLTENQSNSHERQPYLVELEEKEVIITQTTIIKK